MTRSIVLKTVPMQRTEGRLGEPLEDFLRRRYHDEGKTLRQIGDELDIDAGTVSRWMRTLGVEARFPGPRRAAA